jgi:hypothetical protein
MSFWKWYWGDRRYIVNQAYDIVIGLSVVSFYETPVLSASTIAVALSIMIWRYQVWKRRNPDESASRPNPEDEL